MSIPPRASSTILPILDKLITPNIEMELTNVGNTSAS